MAIYVFAVAISEYQNPANNLEGVRNDIGEFLRIIGHWDIADLEILRDANASSQNIKRGLNALLEKCGSGDVACFFFSGHGVQLPPEWSGADDEDGQDEALVPYEGNLSSLITDNWFANFLRFQLEGEITFWAIIDACYSGDITKQVNVTGLQASQETKSLSLKDIELDEVPRSFPRSHASSLRELSTERDNVVAYGAAEADKLALTKRIDGKLRSVFTWSLSKAISEDNSLGIDDLNKRVNEIVDTLTDYHNPTLTRPEPAKDRELFSSFSDIG